ncbi:putative peptidase domain-containing protein [Corynascus novoguineensis]|uniref:Peptidase domain-containing protein n=1 Tax=Corynascus novoguineensis TaxID=1126955 RepID=A0AAN7HEJ7_9PEZI|nr:putative peptidase domain-containing protein [Corynascus novoguineensis]
MRPHVFSIVFCSLGRGVRAHPATPTEGSAAVTSSSSATTTVSTSTAAPTPYDFATGAVTSYPIHQSCNSTLRRQLERALDETVELAAHARDHILRWGVDSPFVQKYFGVSNDTVTSGHSDSHSNSATVPSTATPLGWYSRIVAGDKRGMTFRCDDPDRNCATQDGWAGHWRGENATQETVICPLSYSSRRWLDSICGLGHTVAGSPLNTFWATDLLHRVLHVPRISEDAVGHYADGYEDVLELAAADPARAAVDSNTLQYFALDVYAYDVAAPGVGCTGKPDTSA